MELGSMIKGLITKKPFENIYWNSQPLIYSSDSEKNFNLFKMIYELYKLENPVTEPIYNSYPTTLKLWEKVGYMQ